MIPTLLYIIAILSKYVSIITIIEWHIDIGVLVNSKLYILKTFLSSLLTST